MAEWAGQPHFQEQDVVTICEDEPLSAAVRCERRYGLARGDDWRARLESVSEMRADAATFRVWTSLWAFENEECLFSRTWTFEIPRDGGVAPRAHNPGGTKRIDRRAVHPHDRCCRVTGVPNTLGHRLVGMLLTP